MLPAPRTGPCPPSGPWAGRLLIGTGLLLGGITALAPVVGRLL